jgi:hypothetical protein
VLLGPLGRFLPLKRWRLVTAQEPRDADEEELLREGVDDDAAGRRHRNGQGVPDNLADGLASLRTHARKMDETRRLAVCSANRSTRALRTRRRPQRDVLPERDVYAGEDGRWKIELLEIWGVDL